MGFKLWLLPLDFEIQWLWIPRDSLEFKSFFKFKSSSWKLVYGDGFASLKLNSSCFFYSTPILVNSRFRHFLRCRGSCIRTQCFCVCKLICLENDTLHMANLIFQKEEKKKNKPNPTVLIRSSRTIGTLIDNMAVRRWTALMLDKLYQAGCSTKRSG